MDLLLAVVFPVVMSVGGEIGGIAGRVYTPALLVERPTFHHFHIWEWLNLLTRKWVLQKVENGVRCGIGPVPIRRWVAGYELWTFAATKICISSIRWGYLAR